MKKIFLFPLLFFLVSTALFFFPFFVQNKVPVPADTIVGMYFPFRDFYAKDYPRGIPFKNYQITDPVRQQYPWKVLAIENLKRMELPLWNPYNFAGTPLLANFQSAVFYPFNILFFILPFQLAWGMFIVLQSVLAMLFMYLYLRGLKLRLASSFLGAISFGFCGFFVSWMEWSNVVSTGLWLPLLLFAADKILTAKKVKFHWYLILLAALVCAFFAGHLQVFFYLFSVFSLYFLAKWFQSKRDKKVLFSYIFVNVIFLAATFIQWFPTLQFIAQSARNFDQDWHNPGWFVPWQNLTQFIAPDFFGNPATLNYWGVWNYGEFIGYIGMLPFIFALYAIILVRRKLVWFFSLLVLLGLVFALPDIFAKIPFKLSLPFLSTSQPTRLIYLVDFGLSILAAFGFEVFLQAKKKIYVPLLILGLFMAVFWSFVLFNQFFPTTWHATSDNLAVTKNNLKLPSLLYFVSLLIFIFYFFAKKVKNAQKIFILLVLFVTIVDLYRFSAKYLTFSDTKYLFPDTKIISYLKQQPGLFRVVSNDSRIFPPNFSIMYKIQTPDGYDPLYLLRYAEFSAALARGNPNIDTPFGFNRIITIQNVFSKLTDLLNVKYVIALTQIDSSKFIEVMREGDTILYENKDVLPRAFFVILTIPAQGKQEAINKLFAHANDLQNTAVVEDSLFLKPQSWNNYSYTSEVKVKNYKENTVIIETKNNAKGFLVISDIFYPTWRAKICSDQQTDCQETKIYLTDYTFRGVIVPPGNHSIIFYNSLL